MAFLRRTPGGLRPPIRKRMRPESLADGSTGQVQARPPAPAGTQPPTLLNVAPSAGGSMSKTSTLAQGRPPQKPSGGGFGGVFGRAREIAQGQQPGRGSALGGIRGAINTVKDRVRARQPASRPQARPQPRFGEAQGPTFATGKEQENDVQPVRMERPTGDLLPVQPQVQPAQPKVAPAVEPALPKTLPVQPSSQPRLPALPPSGQPSGPIGGGIPPADGFSRAGQPGIEMTQTGQNSFAPVTPVNQEFTATDNLRGTQINPATTSGQTAALDQAFEAANQGGAVSPEQQQAREAISGGLGGLAGPDRTQLALDSFKQFQEAGEPAFQQRLTDVGRKAAALGRIGSGVTTSELGDVQLQRERDLNRRGQELSTEAAGLTLSDRLGSLGGAVGAAGTLGGLDLGQGELGLGRANTLGSLGGQQFQQGLTGREELRGERGFQDQLARTAADRRVQQAQMEHNFGQDRFGNETSRLGLAGQFGLGGNPFGFLQASNQVPQGNTFGTFAGIGQGQAGQAPVAPAGNGGGGFDVSSLFGGAGASTPSEGIFSGQGIGAAGQQPTPSLFGPRPTLGGGRTRIDPRTGKTVHNAPGSRLDGMPFG